MLSENLEEYIEEHTGSTVDELALSHIEVISVPEAGKDYVVLTVCEEFFGEYDSFDHANLVEDINFIKRERLNNV